MTIAMFVFLLRARQWEIAWSALIVGLIGGVGFAGGQYLKLAGMIYTEWPTNWHSLLEQTYGLINGLGIAVAVGVLASRTPTFEDDPPPERDWTYAFAIAFTLLFVTFVNIRKNVEAVWLDVQGQAADLYGIPLATWFNYAYLAIAVTAVVLIVLCHRGREMALLPDSWLGRGQLFYLVLLWWVVLGNLSRTMPFMEQRLATEGIIHLNTCLCTLLVLLVPRSSTITASGPTLDYVRLLWRTALVGTIAATLLVLGATHSVRAMRGPKQRGDEPVGGAAFQLRFPQDEAPQFR